MSRLDCEAALHGPGISVEDPPESLKVLFGTIRAYCGAIFTPQPIPPFPAKQL